MCVSLVWVCCPECHAYCASCKLLAAPGVRAAGVRAGAGLKSCVSPKSYTLRPQPPPSGRLAPPRAPAAAAASGPLLPARAAVVLAPAAWPAADAAASSRPQPCAQTCSALHTPAAAAKCRRPPSVVASTGPSRAQAPAHAPAALVRPWLTGADTNLRSAQRSQRQTLCGCCAGQRLALLPVHQGRTGACGGACARDCPTLATAFRRRGRHVQRRPRLGTGPRVSAMRQRRPPATPRA
jgi:hypothetical protein